MRKSRIEDDLKNNFEEFFVQAFAKTHKSKELEFEPYLRYVCDRYQNLRKGDRIVFNQPPRSLKSWAAKYFAAWHLGRHPSHEVMIVSNTQKLSETIAYDIRKILRADWYRRIFPDTEISGDRAGLGQLKTTSGGGIFAGSVEGSLAGFGADLLILDDPNKIDDASKPDNLEVVNKKFDGEIYSRLNNRKHGIVVVVQHRLNANDLSGHVIEKGYEQVVFPLVAPRKKTYTFSNGETWQRLKNEILIPNSYSSDDIEDCKKIVHPPFCWYYQQGQGREQHLPLRIEDFRFVDQPIFVGPPVVSIDTAQRHNSASSFNVIQVWRQTRDTFHLVNQFRERCDFANLERAAKQLISRHRPSAVLIENAAQGPALLSRLTAKFDKVDFIPVEPIGSKIDRLQRHRAAIRKGKIFLPRNWKDAFDYIYELVDFPSGPSDQVDATTQYLDFMASKPILRQHVPRTDVAVCLGSASRNFEPNASSEAPIGIALGSHFRRRYY